MFLFFPIIIFTSSAISFRASSLDHKVRYDSVENQIIIISSFR